MCLLRSRWAAVRGVNGVSALSASAFKRKTPLAADDKILGAFGSDHGATMRAFAVVTLAAGVLAATPIAASAAVKTVPFLIFISAGHKSIFSQRFVLGIQSVAWNIDGPNDLFSRFSNVVPRWANRKRDPSNASLLAVDN